MLDARVLLLALLGITQAVDSATSPRQISDSKATQCSKTPGDWVSEESCPEGGAHYYKMKASPGDNQDGWPVEGDGNPHVHVLMELRSPADCSSQEQGCVSYAANLSPKGGGKGTNPLDLKPAGGYDVFVAKNCIPDSKNYDVFMDTGVFTSKQVFLHITADQTYYIALVHNDTRNGDTCSFKMSRGALYGKGGTCGELEKMDGPGSVAKCAMGEPKPPEPAGTPIALIIVPIVIVVVVLGGGAGLFLARKKKKDARMGKFAALSRGQQSTGGAGQTGVA